jgi:AMIN domain
MPLERRHCSRCTVQPAGYAWLGSDHKAMVLNVGDCGIGILGSSAIKSDCEVELRIMLDLNSSIFKAKGKIAWANDTGEAGIHLQLREWQEYAQQWRSLSKRAVSAIQPVARPATSATLPSAAEQVQTVGYADDECVVTQLRECYLRGLEADLEAKRVRRVRIKYLAVITLAGLFCGGTVWLLRGRAPLFGSAITPPSAASESQQVTISPAAPTPSSAASPQPPAAAAVSLSVVDAQPRVAFSEVLPGISYEPGPNLVRFLVDLPEHLALHAVALRNPDRIYFDVPTSAARVRRKSVDVSNDFVRRIRVSPRDGGVTRIVLDLKCSCTYRFQPSSDPRHRLQIEVWPHS